MHKGKLPGMEHLPLHRSEDLLDVLQWHVFPSFLAAVHGITHHRMTHGRTVDADLVGPSSLQIDIKEGCTGKCFLDLPPGFSGPTPATPCGHLFSVGGMTAHRQVDDPGRCLCLCIDQGQISFLNLAFLKLASQTFVGHVIFRHNHHSGSVLVKAVDNARTKLTTNAFQITAMVEQAIDKGPGSVSCRRVNHKAGRLVQHNDIGVFMEDGKWNWFGFAGDRLRRRDFRPDSVVAPDDISGLFGQAIDSNVACPNQSAHIGAGQLREPFCYNRI